MKNNEPITQPPPTIIVDSTLPSGVLVGLAVAVGVFLAWLWRMI